ncbi:MAG: AAA family ATPase [Methylobacter sp.]|nr:MAG: AAA family ATPase [Methylobacter sp.]PPD02501.1 MAG: AAA family ATPase [Methylobacter sp.]PPD17827.1 MAG: AAA family ATPase [Methylobacter sp.]PPD36526.1 MAG: AAA family ATPase [Methylomonas sp.]
MHKFPNLNDFIPPNLTVSNPALKLHHKFNEDDCYALWSAYAAGRPLLVRGKPGTGKSQLAKAIAEQLGWALVSEVIRGSTEVSDLHWHFDAIGRLGEAQAMNNQAYAAEKTTTGKKPLDPLNYLSPGAFWWAYDWQSASEQYTACATRLRPKPETAGDGTSQPNGVVLLLDEIDKAEPDLPNGLLETLGHYRFSVPYIDHADKQANIKNPITGNPERLLVVITTNEERELPTAFVRRCFVHTLKMEESDAPVDEKNPTPKRLQWLIDRGRLHFGAGIAELVYRKAAELLWQDRAAGSHTRYPPGLAEYIDLLTALKNLQHDDQELRLEKISGYALKKEVAD